MKNKKKNIIDVSKLTSEILNVGYDFEDNKDSLVEERLKIWKETFSDFDYKNTKLPISRSVYSNLGIKKNK